MRVHFDSQIFCAQAHGGISRYIASLATALDRIDGVKPLILAPCHSNSHLGAVPPRLVVGHRVSAAPRAATRIASLLGSALLQVGRASDVLHKTYYYPFTQLPSRSKNVLTVHDMIHEKFPQSFSPRDPIARWKRRAVRSADALICVSHHTRKDLLDHYGDIPAERVFVTHLGVAPLAPMAPTRPPSDDAGPPDLPYILFVGSRAGYKNFAGLLEAYQASRWLQDQFGLLCFGGGEFSAQERQRIAQGRHPERIRQTGGPDAALARCYGRAALFVYPSLYEGFGIPPLEAMAMDCPVACSRSSSIPEVVGDAGHYFDPHDPGAIRDALEAVLSSPATSEDLVRRGRRRRTQFSWDRCGQETLGAYRAALAS